MENVRVRIAPSPTGDPHVGTAYIALFNYVFAKKNNGKFIMRIEDTDRERFNKNSENLILKYLNWLGLEWVEGPDKGGDFAPYRQSERKEIYNKYAEELLNKKSAYKCFCDENRLNSLREFQKENKLPSGYDNNCRHLTEEEILEKTEDNIPFVIRLKTPSSGQTIVKDLLRGDIIFENLKLDDQILIKSDGYPTYHLANVVDDHLMKITHVIRAEEWIPSTPKHVLLYNALSLDIPVWVHMSLLRNEDKSKISKRKNHTSLEFYHEEGYLKEAMLNFLALMGWNIGEEREIFTIEEMIEKFDFSKISLGGPVFNIDKLNWINREYMRSYDLDGLYKLALPFFNSKFPHENDEIFIKKMIEDKRASAHTLRELALQSHVYIELPNKLFEDLTQIEKDAVLDVLSHINTLKVVDIFKQKITKEQFTLENIKKILEEIKEELSLTTKTVYPSIRIFISGELKGSELADFVFILGKERTLKRIEIMENFFDKL